MSFNLSRSNSGASEKKKHIFSSLERKLIVTLVRERPVIEDNKGNDSINKKLRKQAWEDLAAVFNEQPNVTHRTSIQLKKCWENMKSLRKKELSAKSCCGGARSVEAHFSAVSSDKKGHHPYINFKDSGVDSRTVQTVNGSIVKVEVEHTTPAGPASLEEEGDHTRSMTYNNKDPTETDEEMTRCSISLQQEQILHDLKVQRENILLEREKNNVAYEKQMHQLQLEKIRLEIDILRKKLN